MEERTEPLLGSKKINNINVLLVTTICFAVFVVAELIGALVGGSLSLLGDACAMSVDVFTYFSNMYAEHLKEKQGYLDIQTKRILEVYVPSFSVCALLGVTGYIISDAVSVIQNNDGGDDVNVIYMYAFSCGNFIVDVISIYMFYWRGNEAFESTTVIAPFHNLSFLMMEVPTRTLSTTKKPIVVLKSPRIHLIQVKMVEQITIAIAKSGISI